MPPAEWCDWQALPGDWTPSPAVLAETLDGGQSFRWRGDSHGVWTGVWSDHVVQVRLESSRLQWRTPVAGWERTGAALSRYLSPGEEWSLRLDALPWRGDAHLAGCMRAFPGLRILRQPFGETLLGFLCSATKQIVQIKEMVALLAERHGAEFAPGFYRLPGWEELAEIPEAELRACRLGFRARFIHETARFLASRPGWLDETELLPYAAAKTRLLELPGVGEKVADCVLLFGAGRLEAFPVDTWILKALARRYALAGWKPAQLAQFGRTHFGPVAGLAQQFLFAWEREFGGR